MSIFSKSFSSFAKKAIIPLVFTLLLSISGPMISFADEVSDAQQNEIQIYIQMQEMRRQIEAEAEALRDSLRPPEPPPAPAPAPVAPAPAPEPTTTNNQQGAENTTPTTGQSGTSGQGAANTESSNPTPTTSGEVNTQTPPASSGSNTGGSSTSGGSSTPFENLVANLHPGGATTEIDASTSATTTASTTPGVLINNQGDDSVTVADSNTTEQDTIETINEANVGNTQEHISNSGNNTISCNGICEGKLTTGAATADTTNGNKINTSNVNTSSGGSGSLWANLRYGIGPDSGIENGGEGAINIGDNTFVKDLAIIQKNDALLKNNYNIVANTGGNDLLTTFKLKDFDAITGDGRSRLTLMNMVNTNLVDSEWWPLYVGIDKEHSADINIMDELLSQFGSTAKFNLFDSNPSASINNTGEDAFNRAVSDLQVKISANSENSGLIHNKIRVACNSGHNTASSPYKIKDLNLTTGDCGSSLTLLNFLNTYLYNAQWAMPVINIFGKWAGDLVLPSPDELLSTPTIVDGSGSTVVMGNSGEDAFSKALVIDRTHEEVFVKNDLNVKSKVNTITNAGGDFLGFSDDLEDSSVNTGNVTNLSSQFMLGNTTKVGGGFFSLMVNDLSKKWLGGVEGAPEDAQVLRDENGVVITAERSGQMQTGDGITVNRGPNASINNTGDDTLNIVEARREREIIINSSNNGSIVNDITVESYTGNNIITGLTGDRIHLKDGDSQTNTTIGNVVNTTMIGAKAMNVIVNVFGEWNGKVVFGKAVDLLSIITPSKSGNLAPGEEVAYTVDYQNANEDESTRNAKLTAQYDASKMMLVDNGGATESPVGTLTWNIGDVAAGGSGQKTFKTRVKSPLPIGNHTIQATSNITSERPESNKENNVDAASNTVTIAGGSGPVTPPSQNGEGTVSGSAQQGNNPPSGTGNGNTQTGNNSSNTGNTSGTQNSSGSTGGNQFSTPGGTSSSGSSAVTLRVSKSSDSSTVAQGGTVKYRVILQNTGTEQSSSVKVFDKLKVNGISSPDDEFSWEVGTVPAGEQITIEYDVNIEPDAELGTYANTAYASGFDSRNKVVLSNDSLATVTVTQGTGNSSGNGGGVNAANNDSSTTGASGLVGINHENQTTLNSSESPKPSTLNPLPSSENHSGPRGVTITHPDGTTEVIGNGSGRSVRSTPNVTRGSATINRAVLLSGALEAQAQTIQDAPITNTNGPVTTLAMASMDQVLGDQVARERNYGFLMWLWLILLILLVIVGFLAWREQRKSNNNF